MKDVNIPSPFNNKNLRLKGPGEDGRVLIGTLNLLRWGQTSSDRDHIKTHKSPHIGEHVGDKMVEFWWGLRWFKKVLVAILGPSL